MTSRLGTGKLLTFLIFYSVMLAVLEVVYRTIVQSFFLRVWVVNRKLKQISHTKYRYWYLERGAGLVL